MLYNSGMSESLKKSVHGQWTLVKSVCPKCEKEPCECKDMKKDVNCSYGGGDTNSTVEMSEKKEVLKFNATGSGQWSLENAK